MYKIFAFFLSLLFLFFLSHHGNRRHVDFVVKFVNSSTLSINSSYGTSRRVNNFHSKILHPLWGKAL